eukprot:s535_g6.t1
MSSESNGHVSLTISLISGRSVRIDAKQGESIRQLSWRAQRALRVGRGRLLDPSGFVLEAAATVQECGLQGGDALTLHVAQVWIASSHSSFAAMLGDGSVACWGNVRYGGDSRRVQDRLKNVQQVQATRFAFAAILADGSVVTWGNARFGGDSASVQEELKHVQHIQATESAFAAILADGSVVAWGDVLNGGDSRQMRDKLKNVHCVQATESAFAAILADGSVVTWGDDDSGGDSAAVQSQLKTVCQVQATRFAFAAIVADGLVVTWGDVIYGGDSSSVRDKLKNVQQVQATESAFAAILSDGSVVTWGDGVSGGHSSAVQDRLRTVQQVQATKFAFAAILTDSSVVTWGDVRYGGDSNRVLDQLKDVQHIQATESAFAAILADGSVVTWGDDDSGRDSGFVQNRLKSVCQVQATKFAFAAILADGSVVTWGDVRHGGDSSRVQYQLKSVHHIQATESAFAAILADGSVVTWGDDVGGDSARVQDQLRNLEPRFPLIEEGTDSKSTPEEEPAETSPVGGPSPYQDMPPPMFLPLTEAMCRKRAHSSHYSTGAVRSGLVDEMAGRTVLREISSWRSEAQMQWQDIRIKKRRRRSYRDDAAESYHATELMNPSRMRSPFGDSEDQWVQVVQAENLPREDLCIFEGTSDPFVEVIATSASGFCFRQQSKVFPVESLQTGTSNASILVASSWNAETAASDVTVRLHNLQTFYTASMEVGTPPVPVKMMVDSGSSNMWVKQRSEFGIMELDSVDSFELGPRPPPVHFQYGVGDARFGALLLQLIQDFLLAQVINNIGNLQEFDGFLGLAFPQMLDVGRITFLQQLQRQGGFRNLGFALCLRGETRWQVVFVLERGDSTLSLGEVEDLVQDARDKTGMPGLSLQVHGLERESELRAGLPGTLLFWMVPMNLRVKRFELLMDLSARTSLMLLSQKPYDETMEALTYGTFVDPHSLLDCETTNLNDLIVHFASGGRELEVRLESKDLLLPVAMSPEGRSMCSRLHRIGIGLIAASPPPLPSMILGDVFLRKVHVIHDMAGPTVTLVPDATGRAEPSQYYEGRAALKFDPSLASWLPALLLSSMGGYLAFVLCRVSGPYLPLQETTDDYIKL